MCKFGFLGSLFGGQTEEKCLKGDHAKVSREFKVNLCRQTMFGVTAATAASEEGSGRRASQSPTGCVERRGEKRPWRWRGALPDVQPGEGGGADDVTYLAEADWLTGETGVAGVRPASPPPPRCRAVQTRSGPIGALNPSTRPRLDLWTDTDTPRLGHANS